MCMYARALNTDGELFRMNIWWKPNLPNLKYYTCIMIGTSIFEPKSKPHTPMQTLVNFSISIWGFFSDEMHGMVHPELNQPNKLCVCVCGGKMWFSTANTFGSMEWENWPFRAIDLIQFLLSQRSRASCTRISSKMDHKFVIINCGQAMQNRARLRQLDSEPTARGKLIVLSFYTILIFCWASHGLF